MFKCLHLLISSDFLFSTLLSFMWLIIQSFSVTRNLHIAELGLHKLYPQLSIEYCTLRSYKILFHSNSACGHYFFRTGLYKSVFYICSFGKLLFRQPVFSVLSVCSVFWVWCHVYKLNSICMIDWFFLTLNFENIKIVWQKFGYDS